MTGPEDQGPLPPDHLNNVSGMDLVRRASDKFREKPLHVF